MSVSRSASGMDRVASVGGYSRGASLADALAVSVRGSTVGGVGERDEDEGRTASDAVDESSGGIRIGEDVGGADERLARG